MSRILYALFQIFQVGVKRGEQCFQLKHEARIHVDEVYTWFSATHLISGPLEFLVTITRGTPDTQKRCAELLCGLERALYL